MLKSGLSGMIGLLVSAASTPVEAQSKRAFVEATFEVPKELRVSGFFACEVCRERLSPPDSIVKTFGY